MNIRIVILAIILATTSCTSQTSVNYADILKDCLSEEDISLLNEACQIFETQLTNKYSEQELGQAYKAFLEDIQTMNLSPNFFVTTDSKEIFGRMKNSKTFDKIWTTLSYVETYDDIKIYTPDGQQDKPQNEFDPYCTNPSGAYLECFTKKNNNKTIADYLEAIKSAPGVSPGLTASVLKDNLTKEDFDNGLTRLIIAINFYFEIGLMFEKK